MLDTITSKDYLQFKDLSAEDKASRGILGTLYGPIASTVDPTRNERFYSDELWEKAFEHPLVKEAFKNGGLIGEVEHPVDRVDTDLNHAAVCMPEPPKKDKDGHLIGRFDILDTPGGKLVYTLAKYGYKLGTSSRGDGSTTMGYDGESVVDPDTYILKAFDIVYMPSLEDARLSFNESVQSGKTFKQSMNEALDSVSKSDRNYMKGVLEGLHIDYKEEAPKSTIAADDARAGTMKSLREALKTNKNLEAQIRDLQEKLSVSYTKEARLQESVEKFQAAIVNLSETAQKSKALEKRVAKLESDIADKNKLLESMESELSTKQSDLDKMSKTAKQASAGKKSLNESLTKKDKTIDSLTKQLESQKRSSKKQVKSLNESIEDLKQDSTIKAKEYSDKLAKSNRLVEHYKKVANQALSKYIDMKAQLLGIRSEEITKKLTEGYTFTDIDRVCEDLREYKMSTNKLPFNVTSKSQQPVKMKVTESKEPLNKPSPYDDIVDDSLIDLFNKFI